MVPDTDIDEIIQFYNSQALHRLQSLSCRETFLEVCGKRTSETAHTAFLKWLFENKEFSRLPLSPTITFIRLYSLKAHQQPKIHTYSNKLLEDLLKKFRTGEIKSIEKIIVRTEVPTTDRRFVDLELLVTLSNDNKLRCCIENKLYTKEHDKQCDAYYTFYENKSITDNIPNIYIFLSPDEDNSTTNPHYVHILYQELYDSVLFPLYEYFREHHSNRSISYLKEYIDTLTSFSLEQNFSPIVMSNEYKELLQEIYNNHRDIFFEAIHMYGNKEEKDLINKTSYSISYSGGKIIYAIGYTKMAKAVIETLLANGVTEPEIINNLGTVDIKNFDSTVVSEESKMGSSSRYQKKPIGSTALYLNNQWNADKAKAFISLAKSKYPKLSVK